MIRPLPLLLLLTSGCSLAAPLGDSGVWTAIDSGALAVNGDDGADGDPTEDVERVGGLAPLRFNELLADSDEESDWIEIANPNDRDVHAAGWGLTDGDPTAQELWVLPAGTWVPAEGYLLIWADDGEGDEDGPHAPFKLKAGGETLWLIRPDGQPSAELRYPALERDHSFIRLDSQEWAISEHPTPGAENRR